MEHQQQIEQLQEENSLLKADIKLTVNSIVKLLQGLKIMKEDGTIDFRISQLLRTLPSMLLNEKKMTEQFGFLADLGPIIEKHAALNNTEKP
jgi:hypothetical protein